MGKWTHILLEAFCMYASSKDEESEFFEMIDKEGGGHEFKSTGIQKNPSYIKAERPDFCKKKYKGDEDDMCPSDECYMEDCKFLATCPVDKKDYDVMMKAWVECEELHKIEDD
jgi:hypothetical protein